MVKPPTSRAGRLGLSAAALAAGAAAGGAAGNLYTATSGSKNQQLATAAGALLGLSAVGLAGLAADEFSPGGWGEVGKTTAVIGLGGIVAVGAVGLARRVVALRSASALPPALPPAGGSSPSVYTATSADSGRALKVAVGDQILVTLPANSASGVTWQWSAPPQLLTYAAHTESNGNETDTFTAVGAGAGILQAKLSDGSATFVLNVQVVS